MGLMWKQDLAARALPQRRHSLHGRCAGPTVKIRYQRVISEMEVMDGDKREGKLVQSGWSELS
jgi:hypothetical protein